MTQTIYHIALFTAIFASGMLAGYLLKIFITACNAKKISDQEWEETKRLIAESEENMPTADYVFDKEGAHLILNQKGQPTFKASFYSQLQMYGWVESIQCQIYEDMEKDFEDEESICTRGDSPH